MAGSLPTIPRIRLSDLKVNSFVETYQRQGLPVIITELLNDESAWTLEYLCEKLGSLQFPVRYYGQTRYQQDKREWNSTGSGVEAKTLSFVEYAELLCNGEAASHDIYLARCSLTQTKLANNPALQSVEQGLRLKFPATGWNLWLGPGGHTSCLHYDPMDGVLMQMYGAKRIVLFPPAQLYNLYPFSVWNHLRYGLKRRAVYSQVYPDRPDFESFPNFKQALEYRSEVILNQGELLFIPCGWWHEVSAMGDGVVCSVNRWWHVPLPRAYRLWSKWRTHFGSLLALPHLMGDVWAAVWSSNVSGELSKLFQRL